MATTINTYSVGLTLDAADYINKSTLAGNETRRLSRAIEDARTPMEKFTLSQTRLDKALEKGAIDRATYNRLLDASKAKMDAATRSAIDQTKSIDGQGKSMAALAGQVKGLVAAYIGVNTVTKSLKLAVEAEDAAVAFEVLTGSVNDGAVLLQQVRKFAERSPITFSGAQQAAKTMLSFGIEVQQVEKNLQMLSDVTGGNNERFKMLALSFSQMSAAGRLMGQDLLQMINAGFNPLQQISKTTGESLVDLKKRMEDGAISSEEVRQAFIDATEAGGMFYGMTERLAETMGGKLNIALSDMEKAGVAAGQAMSTLVITLTDGFSEGAGFLSDMVWLIEKMSDGLSFVAAGFKDIFKNIASGAERGADRFNEMGKVLDLIEKRNKEREEASKRGPSGGFESVATATTAATQIQKSNEDADKAASDRRDAMVKMQEKSDKLFENALSGVKDSLDGVRGEMKVLEELDAAFTTEVANARQAAFAFFEAERQRDAKMRADVQRGPGAGIEVGSEQAAKFLADQANRAIGVAAVPERPTPGEKEIAEKTKELLAAQRESNATQQQQLQTQIKLLEEFRENKFTRIR